MSIPTQRYGSSDGELRALAIQHPGCGEQGLVSVELELGNQPESIPRRQRASCASGQLLNRGAGMLIERCSLNRFG